MAETVLIFGISGQDGAYLAALLLARGFEVHGASRDCENNSFNNLVQLGLRERVYLHSTDICDYLSVQRLIKTVQPSRIFNLAAQSSVGLSFEEPTQTLDSIIKGTINILETIRAVGVGSRFYNASSGECFGETDAQSATENAPFRPRSPYGVGKAAAFWAVANYREAYNIFACSGILFNHESPLRSSRYVTQKIVRGAADIAEGKADRLRLGTLDIARDWGWAPEYVDAMARMLDLDRPEDFVIATGAVHTLEDFTSTAFGCFDLDWRTYVEIDPKLKRPSDIRRSAGNAAKAAQLLGWRAEATMPMVVRRLVEAERTRRQALLTTGSLSG